MKNKKDDGFTYSINHGTMQIFTPDNRLVATIQDCSNMSSKDLENLFLETLDNSSFSKV